MNEWFKEINEEVLKLIRYEVSIPSLDSKPRDDRLDVKVIDEELQRLWKGGILPAWSEKQVKCLLLLWHDYLEPAHQLAQDERTPEFNYFHAIIHRREGDFFNSRFWLRQVDDRHIALLNVAREVKQFLSEKGEIQLLEEVVKDDGWDSLEFLEEVMKASKLERTSPQVKLLTQIQTIEFACWLKFLCLP